MGLAHLQYHTSPCATLPQFWLGSIKKKEAAGRTIFRKDFFLKDACASPSMVQIYLPSRHAAKFIHFTRHSWRAEAVEIRVFNGVNVCEMDLIYT